MAERAKLNRTLEEMAGNEPQLEAIHHKEHCVVLAGPGSGKTRTLTTAIARVLLEDVEEPRGIACITYSNECAMELENRLVRLGVERDDRVYIGTIHSFAMGQIIIPYARCVIPGVTTLSVATDEQRDRAVRDAYAEVYNDHGNATAAWKAATQKRKLQVDRDAPEWLSDRPEMARFIESYERRLMEEGVIDFDGMPLLAYKMVKEHPWIAQTLRAKFPILFVDEYQDLGVALHALVLKLCFDSGIRLFAVGDPDQSVYGFTGARPELFRMLSEREDVHTVVLPFNYRCGVSIIEASKSALGEEREFRAPDGAHMGNILFDRVDGALEAQAAHIIANLVPAFRRAGVPLEEIAVLYRAAWQGDILSQAAEQAGIPHIRADSNSLIPRGNQLSRLVESAAEWATGGWRNGDPLFRKLAFRAATVVFGASAGPEDHAYVEESLAKFLHRTRGATGSTHEWLVDFRDSLVSPWRSKARSALDNWEVIDEMIRRTSPDSGRDMSLPVFSGRMEEAGRLNLMTLHSAKGREFDVVILFDMNRGSLPSARDSESDRNITEARRLFYVGVTRARRELRLVFRRQQYSPWVGSLYHRLHDRGMLGR